MPAGEPQPAIDAVLVEAPYAQVEQLLQVVQTQSTNYLNVTIDPAPADASQQNFTQYARSGPTLGAALRKASPAPEKGVRNLFFELRQNTNLSFSNAVAAEEAAQAGADQSRQPMTGGREKQQAISAQARRVNLLSDVAQDSFQQSTSELKEVDALRQSSAGRPELRGRATSQSVRVLFLLRAPIQQPPATDSPP